MDSSGARVSDNRRRYEIIIDECPRHPVGGEHRGRLVVDDGLYRVGIRAIEGSPLNAYLSGPLALKGQAIQQLVAVLVHELNTERP